MPTLYDDLDDQIKKFLESMQTSIQFFNSVKQWKKKKSKQPWFDKEVKSDLSKKRQAMRRFGEKPTASNKTRLLRIRQKTNYSVKEAKCNHFSNVFSNCLKKTKKFYKAPNKMTRKRNVTTNLHIINENKEAINSPTVFADMMNKKC